MKQHSSTHTDTEVAKQLEELWHIIERGIITANHAVQQAGAIHTVIIQESSKIEQLKLDTSSFAQTIQKNIHELQEQQFQLENTTNTLNNIRNQIISQLEEIGDYQTKLNTCQQELKLVISTVDATKTQAQKLETILSAFTQLPQQFEHINQLAAKIESNNQQVARYHEKSKHQADEIVRTHSQIQNIKTQIETIITDFGGKQALDKIQINNQSICNQLQQAQAEIERLHQKLEIQTKKQKQFSNWLLVVSFTLILTLIFTIIR
ncbi:MAG: hypothetical protein IGS39_17080 [Calothrix sp. C42_A2020_038]|nr:hypothetical protein [Calothrix sp. C42_A2020_038]